MTHVVDDLAGYTTALTACVTSDATVIIGSHRTVLVDVQVAASVPVVTVVRGVLHPTHRIRLVDPATGELADVIPDGLPWELLADDVARWVGISEASAASIRGCAPVALPVQMIHNGVAIPEWRPPPPASTAGGRARLVVVARAAPWKNLDRLVDAVADPRLRDRVTVDIYGGFGSAQPVVEAQIAACGAPVVFRGWVEDLPRRIAGAHALVSVAELEGFGRGILDAAVVGVPAVVPRAGASTEIVLDGITGFTFDPRSPDGLVDVLDRVVNEDPVQLAALGWCARARALGYFTPARCADQYLQLCHELLSQPTLTRASG
ncbi:glycosyltransferase family 4 protein [Frankia sp. Cr2]|uniref:glycosyltransferase family 4 protein n=1 Tax=Frankia sp. Cr2 TaxID=3073932 RepID=UPI002AD45D60|nr:glycosyltransferase family 4 protein [Frankia sp. Cr2]